MRAPGLAGNSARCTGPTFRLRSTISATAWEEQARIRNELCGERSHRAWVSFAKTGNPNNAKTPNWPAYDAAKRATMIFDNETRVENDPRAEIRKFWQDMPTARRG